MKCPKCHGTGKEDIVTGLNCDRCWGRGEVEVTNEEWFCGLSTEEKAKYIAKSMFFYDSQFGLTMVEALSKSIEYEDGLNDTIEHDVIEWLKQPHREEKHE